jgi:hypothetical protein
MGFCTTPIAPRRRRQPKARQQCLPLAPTGPTRGKEQVRRSHVLPSIRTARPPRAAMSPHGRSSRWGPAAVQAVPEPDGTFQRNDLHSAPDAIQRAPPDPGKVLEDGRDSLLRSLRGKDAGSLQHRIPQKPVQSLSSPDTARRSLRAAEGTCPLLDQAEQALVQEIEPPAEPPDRWLPWRSPDLPRACVASPPSPTENGWSLNPPGRLPGSHRSRLDRVAEIPEISAAPAGFTLTKRSR